MFVLVCCFFKKVTAYEMRISDWSSDVCSSVLLCRWVRMVTIPNQSGVPKAYQEFDDAGRMNPSPLYDRIVDVMEELVRFTVLLRPHGEQLVDRYSERKAGGRPVERGTDLSAIAVDGR